METIKIKIPKKLLKEIRFDYLMFYNSKTNEYFITRKREQRGFFNNLKFNKFNKLYN